MKQILSLLLLTVMLSLFNLCSAMTAGPSLQWTTNYEEAVNQSKATNKPILLFFTGTGWCSACARLEKEALSTPEFIQNVGNQFIFVKVDFPRGTAAPLDPKTNAQNKQLLSKFGVRSFPTILLLDSQLQQIGMTGYRPGGGSAYAAHLMKLLNDYKAYKQGVQNVGGQKLSGIELKQLLEKARELNLESDELAIISEGIKSDQKSFFQLERYRLLAQEGLIHEAEAVELKQQLLASDPTNGNLTHYNVAVIDFEAYSDEMEKENYSPELAIAPLVDYLEKFGAQDKENQWRLQMIISQVYLDKNKLAQALRYAQSSYETAPPAVQAEIATAIRNLQNQSHTQ